MAEEPETAALQPEPESAEPPAGAEAPVATAPETETVPVETPTEEPETAALQPEPESAEAAADGEQPPAFKDEPIVVLPEPEPAPEAEGQPDEGPAAAAFEPEREHETLLSAGESAQVDAATLDETMPDKPPPVLRTRDGGDIPGVEYDLIELGIITIELTFPK